MTTELKRALVECLAKAMFAVSHEEPWEQAEELTRRIYLEEAPAGVDAVCLKLARRIIICGTGHEAPPEKEARFIGTLLLYGGTLVLHVFEQRP